MVQDLVADDAAHLEALLARDRIHNHVAVDADEVLAVQDGVLVLAGGVDDLQPEVLVAIADDFTEGVLDGGVVGVDEVAVDVLDGERALACVYVRQYAIAICVLAAWREWIDIPTDLLPTMAILRCFCCGAMTARQNQCAGSRGFTTRREERLRGGRVRGTGPHYVARPNLNPT